LRAQKHPSDETFLKLVDRELPAAAEVEARKHLDSCRDCAARYDQITKAAAAISQAWQESVNLPPSSLRSRSRLKSRLAELGSSPKKATWWQFATAPRIWLPTFGIFVLLLAAGAAHRPASWISGTRISKTLTKAFSSRNAVLPDRTLTPGSVYSVRVADVCPATGQYINGVIPTEVEAKVLAKYGMAKPKPEEYELDYLITPELGGADDPRNLWPEPRSSEWNSYVKDDLENRLHQLVCAGRLDLSTAQHDIASDWISAYKKYFDTDRPIARRTTKS
jgi:hypothetical protein